ncbi:MAG: DNA-binding domain-containing protein [Gammaproteobacteria bacterium]|nr:DNA-binding domain-containing protein [Gammaproteobacteria bacterium]
MIKTDKSTQLAADRLILPQLSDYQHEITIIQALANIGHQAFTETYQEALLYLLEKSSNDAAEPLIDRVLHQVIPALRRRRAYLLPLGGDMVQIQQQQTAWTYAVFIAVIADTLRDDSSAANQPFITAAGQTWLKRYPVLWQCWQNSLLHPEQTIFARIIRPNQEGLGAPIHYWETLTGSLPVEKSPTLAEQFLAWLTAGMANQTIAINQPDAFIHGVSDGIFLQMPTVMESFFRSSYCAGKKVTHTALLNALTEQPGLVNNAKGDTTHHYCWDDWQKRQLRQGIILKPSPTTDNCSIPCNPRLTPDPLAKL